MRVVRHPLVVAAAAALALPATAQTPDAVDGSTWAIVIGIQVHEDDTLIPSRKGAYQTANAIYAYIADPARGGIGADHTRLLCEFGADRRSIQAAFEEVRGLAKDSDRLLVYAGLRTALAADADGKITGYFLPYDAKLDSLATTAIAPADLAAWISAVPARRRVVFLDAAFADAIRAPGAENAAPPADYLNLLGASAAVIAATDGAKPVPEDGLEHPLLGFSLYTAMQGPGDKNRDGKLTFAEFLQHHGDTVAAVYQGQEGNAPHPYSNGVEPEQVLAAVPQADPRCPDGTRLVGEVCMDMYESPNKPGAPVYNPGNWFGAVAVCQQAGKRLCSTQEWMLACQGPGWKYPYGNEYIDSYCNVGDTEGHLERVGSRPFCVSAWGIYDLIGNAQEWAGTEKKENATVLGGRFFDAPGESIGCRESLVAGNPILEGAELGMRCCIEPKPTE
ncbi:MAG TPA: SUMF1/EgtB/PvdO family nonheme iron enzyme [Armatimonadota bacterium]|nr:SUMF1/EgtB/PvdO family nonheme iron enzyme [Armatimonadota bacterium]